MPKDTKSGSPEYYAAIPPERLHELQVTATSPICRNCGGTGKVPGTTSGQACGLCYGLGRTGAYLPEDMPEGS